MKILIAGEKGSGKTTIANMLKDKLGYEVINIADPLKRACALVTSMPLSLFYNQEYKEKKLLYPIVLTKHHVDAFFLLFGYTPDLTSGYAESIAKKCISTPLWNLREILQFVGTDVLRGYNDNIHLDFTNKTLKDDSIIADVRFENEADYFIDKGNTYLIYMDRDTGPKTDTHISETGVSSIKAKANVVINNNGSMEDLENEVSKIVGSLDNK